MSSESSESPPTSTLQPQSCMMHAMPAHYILLLCHHSRPHALVWPFYRILSVWNSRRRDGASRRNYQKHNLGYGLFDRFRRNTDSPNSNTLNIHAWAQRRWPSATEGVHGTGNITRVNFGWVVRARWFRRLAAF